MIKSFLEDPARGGFILMAMLCVFFLAGSVLLYGQLAGQLGFNRQAVSAQAAEAAWMQSYDPEAWKALSQKVPRPCTAAELPAVRQRQLDILSSAGLEIESARNAATGSAKEGGLGAAGAVVNASGSWEQASAALSRFEKEGLVVITGLDLSSSDGKVNLKIDYDILYK